MHFLYLQYYAVDLDAAEVYFLGGRPRSSLADLEDATIIAQLEDANPNSGYFSTGWTVLDEHPDGIQVSNGTIRLLVDPGEMLPAADNGTVSIRMRPTNRYRMLGWYTTTGDSGPPAVMSASTKYYLTFRGIDEAAVALGAIGRYLNEQEEPFQIKIANSREGMRRQDAGVLYLGDPADSVHPHVRDFLATRLSPLMRPTSPCFAEPIAPGIASAVETRHDGGFAGLSYGQHKCRIVAEGLISAQEASASSPDERVQHIRHAFRRNGLDAAAPFRGRATSCRSTEGS